MSRRNKGGKQTPRAVQALNSYGVCTRDAPQRPETAEELIARAERETGHRVDEDGSPAIDVLWGAMARAMGTSSHDPRDDAAAGVLLQFQASPEGQAKAHADEMLARALMGGADPDVLADLFKR